MKQVKFNLKVNILKGKKMEKVKNLIRMDILNLKENFQKDEDGMEKNMLIILEQQQNTKMEEDAQFIIFVQLYKLFTFIIKRKIIKN